MINQDKIIADYVRSKYPHLLRTTDFAFYKIGRVISQTFQILSGGNGEVTIIDKRDDSVSDDQKQEHLSEDQQGQ
jgi:hypothetical protein